MISVIWSLAVLIFHLQLDSILSDNPPATAGGTHTSQTAPSLLVQLPARIQIIEIHDRIEHLEVAAFSLSAPDRVI